MSDESTPDQDAWERLEEDAWRALGYGDEQIEWFRAPQIVDFSGDVYVRPCNRGINIYKPPGITISLDDLIMDGIREQLPNFSDGELRLAIDIRILPKPPEDDVKDA